MIAIAGPFGISAIATRQTLQGSARLFRFRAGKEIGAFFRTEGEGLRLLSHSSCDSEKEVFLQGDFQGSGTR